MKQLISTLILLTGILFSAVSTAVPLVDPFTITGPGTTSATQVSANEWDLDYSINPAGFSALQWTVTGGPVTANGDYEFDFIYSGFHAFFAVTAFLITSDLTTLVNVGPANCCSSPSAGFNFSGNYTFQNVLAGNTIGFTMGGSNFDSNNVLSGNLNLVQVPEPGTLALLGLGLLGIFGRRRTINSC